MKKTIIIFLILQLIFSCSESNNRTKSLVAENKNLNATIDSLTKLHNKKKNEVNYWYEENYDGEKLIRNGIKNPTEFIENALRGKPELIPLKGVLGGTMSFGKIQLLSDKWLIADFNDGHIEGKGIYEYKLNKYGKLEFELLEMTNKSE